MFWQYENGKLLNLNAVDFIYLDPLPRNGEYHVMASRRGGEPVDLFSSKDAELVERVLLNITNGLEHEGLLIRETHMKTL